VGKLGKSNFPQKKTKKNQKKQENSIEKKRRACLARVGVGGKEEGCWMTATKNQIMRIHVLAIRDLGMKRSSKAKIKGTGDLEGNKKLPRTKPWVGV